MPLSLAATRIALGAILLPQARRVRRTALRLPEAAGPREGVAGTGEPVLRLLVVGDSSAAGVGVERQDQALAGPLARELARKLGGAVAWQLVARTGVDSAEASQLVAQAALRPADVAVLVLGVNDVTGQASAARFVANLDHLVAGLRERAGVREVVACRVPPMERLAVLPQPLRWYLGRHARWLDAALAAWCAARGFVHWHDEFPDGQGMLAADGFHPGPALYPAWAAALAGLIAARQPQRACA